jgi:hypothetical protein
MTAVQVGNKYIDKINNKLLIYALDNANEEFLKNAFKDPNPIFTPDTLNKPLIIREMIVMMHRGANIELILNVLLYADFAKWP